MAPNAKVPMYNREKQLKLQWNLIMVKTWQRRKEKVYSVEYFVSTQLLFFTDGFDGEWSQHPMPSQTSECKHSKAHKTQAWGGYCSIVFLG